MLTYLLPTHNRPARLEQTLHAISALDADAHRIIGGAEVIVVDNDSEVVPDVASHLANGMRVHLIHLQSNVGTAARNVGAQHAKGDWIIMLDDDSYPMDSDHIEVILNADDDVAAIGADIFLPNGNREAGGLPEVFIGCGVAIRRDAFLQVGGYDHSFDYYAEEYDLCAKLILNGWRIVHDQRFRVQHEKVAGGRDMNRILHRLVRNNGWVAQRYAPSQRQSHELSEVVSRYAGIAVKENAACGFASGMAELLQTLNQQPHREMPPELFDRFTGLAHVRQTLASVEQASRLFDRQHRRDACATVVALVDEGKNAWAIRQALHEVGVRIANDESDADALMIGTLSPGPMLDAYEWRRAKGQHVMMPWLFSKALIGTPVVCMRG